MINVNPELVDMIPANFKAHEHSFAKAKPQESYIEVNYSIKKPSKTATKGERDRFINTLLEVRKLLGVSYTANGDTSATGERIIKNAKLKMNKTMFFSSPMIRTLTMFTKGPGFFSSSFRTCMSSTSLC